MLRIFFELAVMSDTNQRNLTLLSIRWTVLFPHTQHSVTQTHTHTHTHTHMHTVYKRLDPFRPRWFFRVLLAPGVIKGPATKNIGHEKRRDFVLCRYSR
jgi:hypothetical protein